jgi:hypothetical protein
MELLTINGKEVSYMAKQEFMSSLKHMPVTITVGPGKTAMLGVSSNIPAAADSNLTLGKLAQPSTHGQLTTFSVPPSVKTMGCLFTTVPPGPVYIRQVDAASWASQRNIEVGWELISLNGEQCRTMQPDTFRTAMRARPLTLAFDTLAKPPQKELNKQGWRPSLNIAAGSLQVQASTKTRKEIMAALFETLDVNKKGRLMSSQMFTIAQLMEFEDGEEEFQEEYQELCEDFGCDPDTGLGFVAFSACLSDEASQTYYCDDRQLLSHLDALGGSL